MFKRMLVALLVAVAVTSALAPAANAKPKPTAKDEQACALARSESTGDPDAAASGRVARLLRGSKLEGAKKLSKAILNANNDAGISAALQDVASWCERRGIEPPVDVVGLQASEARILESLDAFLAIPAPVPYSPDVAAFTAYLEACNDATQVVLDEVVPLSVAVNDEEVLSLVTSAVEDLYASLRTCLDDAYRGASENIQVARDTFAEAIGEILAQHSSA